MLHILLYIYYVFTCILHVFKILLYISIIILLDSEFVLYIFIYMYITCFQNVFCTFLIPYCLILNLCDNVFIFIICTKLL